MNKLEMVDVETSDLVWTGSVDEFMEANEDWPLEDEELEHVKEHAYVIVGWRCDAGLLHPLRSS